MKLVQEQFREFRSVQYYADKLWLSPKYLSETVKTISGKPANNWIEAFVIVEIKIMLKNTDKSIKEIANDLHFTNQSFMGKYFRERTGISPREYRKS